MSTLQRCALRLLCLDLVCIGTYAYNACVPVKAREMGYSSPWPTCANYEGRLLLTVLAPLALAKTIHLPYSGT